MITATVLTVPHIVAMVATWFYMGRMCNRWDRELGTGAQPAPALVNYLLWCIGIPLMLNDYLKHCGYGISPTLIHTIFVGESRWHKRERLEQEHQERAQALEMPIS